MSTVTGPRDRSRPPDDARPAAGAAGVSPQGWRALA